MTARPDLSAARIAATLMMLGAASGCAKSQAPSAEPAAASPAASAAAQERAVAPSTDNAAVPTPPALATPPLGGGSAAADDRAEGKSIADPANLAPPVASSPAKPGAAMNRARDSANDGPKVSKDQKRKGGSASCAAGNCSTDEKKK